MPMTSEATNYGFKGRNPTGRCIVEGRDGSYKITIWAQDMRPGASYSIFMLFPDGGRHAGIGIGNMMVDEKGKGDVRHEFDAQVLDKFAPDELLAVAVVVKGVAGVVSPLCGYRERPINWRHDFFEYAKPVAVVAPVVVMQKDVIEVTAIATKQETDTAEAKHETATTVLAEHEVAITVTDEHEAATTVADGHETATTVADGHETATAAITTVEPLTEVASIVETHIEDVETIATMATQEPTVASEVSMFDLEQSFQDIKNSNTDKSETNLPIEHEPFSLDKPLEEMKKQEPTSLDWQLPKGEMARAFSKALDRLHAETRNSLNPPQPQVLDELFKSREHVTPFLRQSRKTDWIQFTLSDPVTPPINKPDLFDDKFIHAALEKYSHLILGVTRDHDKRRYIIGVPGVFDQSSRKKARRLGFTQFKCHSSEHPSWNEPGYWLMFTSAQD